MICFCRKKKKKKKDKKRKKSQRLNRDLTAEFIYLIFDLCVCALARFPLSSTLLFHFIFEFYIFFSSFFLCAFLSAARQFRRAVWEEMRPVRDAV
jgi:hypothetical protein